MLDDWGDMLGLRGSGSNSIRFDGDVDPGVTGAFEAPFMVDVDVAGGTPGRGCTATRCTAGAAMTIFTLSLAAVTVGGVFNALDEYERSAADEEHARALRSSRGCRTASTRSGSAGAVHAGAKMAEMLLHQAARRSTWSAAARNVRGRGSTTARRRA